MAAISYAIHHGTTPADAAERTSTLLKELVADKPHLFNEVKWGSAGLEAKMTGKGFQGSFTVDDQKISVNVKLGLLARPFKGKVESALKSRLEAEFG